MPSAPLNNVADVMADPQVAARNMIVTADDPDIGPLKMQGNPIKLSAYDDPKHAHARARSGCGSRGNIEGIGDQVMTQIQVLLAPVPCEHLASV